MVDQVCRESGGWIGDDDFRFVTATVANSVAVVVGYNANLA